MRRVAVMHEDSRPELTEVMVVILEYPLVLMDSDEVSTIIETDEELGTWCEEQSLWYNISVVMNR